ncbi:MAG: hypothetical protein U0R44_05645 [Candidatus Micrarchaeia archaeon]
MRSMLTQMPGASPPRDKGFSRREPLHEGQKALGESDLQNALMSLSRRSGYQIYNRFKSAQESLASLFGASIDVVQSAHSGLKVAARLEFLTTHKSIDTDLDTLVTGLGFRLTLKSYPVLEGPASDRYEEIVRTLPVVLRHEDVATAVKDGRGKTVGMNTTRVPVYGHETVVSYEQKMVHIYEITAREHQSADFTKAAESAENLLRLARLLRPQGVREDLPADGKVVPISSARISRSPQPAAPENDDAPLEAVPPAAGTRAG